MPAAVARDLVAQGVAVVPKPRTKPQPKTKTEVTDGQRPDYQLMIGDETTYGTP